MRKFTVVKLLTLWAIVLMTCVFVPLNAQGEVTYPELKLTLTNPSTNPARQQWGEVIQSNLKAVGIECDRVIWDWDTIYDRVLEPPAEIVGLTYEEGGYDALFVGYAIDIDMDVRGMFGGAEQFYPPLGQNYVLYDNDELDPLLDQAMEIMDLETRKPIQWEIQEILYEDQPSMIISFFQEAVAYDPALENYEEGYWYPAWCYPEMWAGLDICILTQTGPVLEFNPLVSTSYYDLTAYGTMFPGLNRRGEMLTGEMVPMIAKNWTVAADNKTWTVHLREDVYWHDDVQLTADDVVFTYQSVMTPAVACQGYGDYLSIFGSNSSIVKVSDFVVNFTLPQPYALFATTVLDDSIVPKHILEPLTYAEYRTDSFNTGLDGDGPIGCGAYKFVEVDTTTSTVKLVKNDDYFLKAELEADSIDRYTIVDFWVTFIEEFEPAIAALKNGEIHFIDSQYHSEAHLNEFDPAWGETFLYTSNGWQELGFNMRNPVWGTGEDTPLGTAEAAKYLRQAVSHCIPRYQIVGEILQGIGTPGDVHSFPGQASRHPNATGAGSQMEPYAFNLTLAKELIKMAGYSYEAPPPTFMAQYGIYLVFGAGLVIAIAGTYFFVRRP